VTDWDRTRDLIAVHGGLARWDPSYGDPYEQPAGVWLSWHGGEPGVEVTATVDMLSQIYLGSPADPAAAEILIPVERVDKFPEPLRTPDAVREPGGALVTLTDLLMVAPTVEQVTEFRMQQERARRTVHITAPPIVFGLTVPRVGDRITVDLDDPTTTISNGPPESRGVVTGVATQVSQAVPNGGLGLVGITTYIDAGAGAPAADINRNLFVVLVLDEPL
jgi:hypothetical protein